MNNEYILKATALGYKLADCKVCGKPVSWDSSKIQVRRDGTFALTGRTQESKKVVNGHEYHICVCEDCFRQKFGEAPSNFGTTNEKTKWAYDITDEDYTEDRKKYAMTLEAMILKYGEEKGRKKWDAYCKRQAETNTFEYKQKTYGWTKEQFDEYNKSRAVTKANLIKRHGRELGTQKWDEYCAQQSLTKSWEYMVEKYGEEKAREINDHKAMTLSNMIRVHGEIKGKQVYNNYIKKIIKARERGYSLSSQEVFDKMRPIVEEMGYTCKYATHGGEHVVITLGKSYFLDFYIPELKIGIEYNGGMFHGDPRLYKDDEYCNPWNINETAKDMRERDQQRYDFLLNNYGIKTYIIWELDYNQGLDVESFIRRILNESK